MTTAKTLTLTAGLAGSIAFGVWGWPQAASEREARSTDALIEHISEPPAVERADASVVVARRPVTASPTARLKASSPEVHDRLKPLLNSGTRMSMASDGFDSAEEFATVAYAARNTEVPFMVLKHKVLKERKSLATAIQEAKPGINAAEEVLRARAAARRDLAGLGGRG